MTMLLTTDEVAELTDIRTGRDKKTREQRQIAALKTMKIPFFVSPIGRPKVARAVLEGRQAAPQVEQWAPRLAA